MVNFPKKMGGKTKPTKTNVVSTGQLGGMGAEPELSAKIGGVGNKMGAKSELKPGVRKGGK
jgi:hypothetical protein